jgi:hypothetical protein
LTNNCHHYLAKTDPGQGAEIKAIIDKTMEDIKELQQVDFTKTYSRPRVFPKHFTKSQSTHASPFFESDLSISILGTFSLCILIIN